MVSKLTLETNKFAAILVYGLVRHWTRNCFVIGFDTLRISLFFTLETGLKKYMYHRALSAEFASCVWTDTVSEKKKVRIKKISGFVGGRGLNPICKVKKLTNP